MSKKYICVDDFIDKYKAHLVTEEIPLMQVIQALKEMPAADVVERISCEECRYQDDGICTHTAAWMNHAVCRLAERKA